MIQPTAMRGLSGSYRLPWLEGQHAPDVFSPRRCLMMVRYSRHEPYNQMLNARNQSLIFRSKQGIPDMHTYECLSPMFQNLGATWRNVELILVVFLQ